VEGPDVNCSQGEQDFELCQFCCCAPTKYLVALYLHEVKEAKAQRIILDGVKDPLIHRRP
jgi:hypothetical protein